MPGGRPKNCNMPRRDKYETAMIDLAVLDKQLYEVEVRMVQAIKRNRVTRDVLYPGILQLDEIRVCLRALHAVLKDIHAMESERHWE